MKDFSRYCKALLLGIITWSCSEESVTLNNSTPINQITIAIADDIDVQNGTLTDPGLLRVENTLTRTLKITVNPQENINDTEITLDEDSNAVINIINQEIDEDKGEITIIVKGINPGEATLSAEIRNGSGINAQLRVAVTQDHFVTTWQGTQIALPVIVPDFEYDYKVDLNNDGIFDRELNGTDIQDHILNFEDEGPHTIRIFGEFPAIFFPGVSQNTRDQIQSLDQWGTGEWLDVTFEKCSNLRTPATDVPDFSETFIEWFGMFADAKNANPDVTLWNTSNVVSMENLFKGATSAQPDVALWNTANVANMNSMFEGATTAQPDVSNWNTAEVSQMSSMFEGATLADPDVSNWDIGGIELKPNNITIVAMQDMFKCSGFSLENYEKALNNFFSQVLEKENPRNIDLGDIPVAVTPNTEAFDEKTDLIDEFGWQINDGVLCEQSN